MGDSIRGQNKDVTKYYLTEDSATQVTFYSDGYPKMAMKLQSLETELTTPTLGVYQGSVPLIGKWQVTFNSASNVDYHHSILGNVLDCKSQTVSESGSKITFSDIGTPGNCMGDSIRGQNKDVTKYYLTEDSATQVTFYSDGYPKMAMKLQSLETELTTPTLGVYQGSVPLIGKWQVTFNSATNVDYHHSITGNVLDCRSQTVSESGSKITFSDIGTPGNCMGDAIRGQNKDVTKYYLTQDSATQVTFYSDGYPKMAMKLQSAEVMV